MYHDIFGILLSYEDDFNLTNLTFLVKRSSVKFMYMCMLILGCTADIIFNIVLQLRLKKYFLTLKNKFLGNSIFKYINLYQCLYYIGNIDS